MQHEDERRVRNLVARYCHTIASKDDAGWADTWADDAEWLVLGEHLRGRDAILAHYRKLVSGVRWVVQLSHDGIVEVEGDTARGEWLILELLQWANGAGGTNVGRYRDAYARGGDGEWRFARRELTVHYLGPPDLSAPAPPRFGERSAS